MGMFDSLMIEVEGRELEIQTKRFDRVLASYRPGDWIGGAMPGVRVYFDRLDLDDEGKLVYRADDSPTRTLTLFIVLVQGVFVEYHLRDGALDPAAIQVILMDLRERWRDSARVQEFLVGALRAKQTRIAALEHRLARIQSVMATIQRMQAGEAIGGKLGLLHEEERKLAAGEDPLAVIAWVLSDEHGHPWLWQGETTPDPLDEYRL